MRDFIHEERIDKRRRMFLKKIISFFFIIFSFFFVFVGITILKPSNPKRREFKYFEVSREKVPKEGVKRLEIQIETSKRNLKVFLVRHEGNLMALSPVCTHLGCFVNYDPPTNEFICPCHGGRYDITGKVLSGPPSQALEKLPVKIEGDKVFVGLKI